MGSMWIDQSVELYLRYYGFDVELLVEHYGLGVKSYLMAPILIHSNSIKSIVDVINIMDAASLLCFCSCFFQFLCQSCQSKDGGLGLMLLCFHGGGNFVQFLSLAEVALHYNI